MLRKLGGLAAILLLVFSLGMTGCSDDDDCVECPDPEEAPALAFVGTETCGTAGCHDAASGNPIYETFIESGHPYKLNEVIDGMAPVLPWDAEHNYTLTADGPAPGQAWNDFAWVIGGYGWKARFVKPDGNVYTAGPDAQLNLDAPAGEDQWVPYHEDEVKPYNYDCFKCHTTGASPAGSWPEGTTGFGTFAFGGIECEECHGMGSQHAFAPETFKLTVDSSPELCGRCHTRDSQNRIAVSGGKVRHHEQYDELIHSPHATIGCGGCHDPHASVRFDDVAMGDGVRQDCTAAACHGGEYDFVADGGNLTHFKFSGMTCTSCHMPKAAKSARADNDYVGDIASHIFSIRTDDGDKDTMWTSDGSFVKTDEFGQAQLTLDFACYGCHVDGNQVGGGTASEKSLTDLSLKALQMHSGGAMSR